MVTKEQIADAAIEHERAWARYVDDEEDFDANWEAHRKAKRKPEEVISAYLAQAEQPPCVEPRV